MSPELSKIEKDFIDKIKEILDQKGLKPIDLSRALGKLTARQRRLCQVLKEGYTMEEASEILKTPRTTLYDEKERIKALFFKENLRDYLD